VADKIRVKLCPCPEVGIRSISTSPKGSLVIAANSAGGVYPW
jgi:hypothetical protein